MSLLVPKFGNEFQWAVSAHGYSTRPSANMGVTVTPGNNAKGTYVALISAANLVNDVYGVLIHINSNAVSAAARDTLVDISVDPAGGTSFSGNVVIPNLIGSCAGTAITGGIWYYFPLAIKAGSSIGAGASVNNATVGTLKVNLIAYGRPVHPELCKTGSRVTAYGVTTGTSTGTAVTPGTTSDGTFTVLASAISQRNWWWQQGVGVNNATITAVGYGADLAVGSSTSLNTIVIQDHMWWGDTAEGWHASPVGLMSGEYDVASGVNVYGRLQATGTAITGLSMAAYGLGD
jgi:hypothetical protein